MSEWNNRLADRCLVHRQQGLSVAKEAAKDNRFLSSLHDFFTIESIPLISNEP
jgi:hypothetical protein